jgi:hypothetical protein
MLSRRQEDERKPPIAVLIGSLLTNRRYCPGTKGRKINERAPHRHTREGGYVVGAGFKPALTSGFRVALAIAQLARNDAQIIQRISGTRRYIVSASQVTAGFES